MCGFCGGDFAESEDPAEGVDGLVAVDLAAGFAGGPDTRVFDAVHAGARGGPAVEDGG